MENKVDFLPEDYIEKKTQRRTNVVCLILFLLVTAGVGGAFAVTSQRQHQINQRSQQVDKEMLQVSDSLKQLELVEAKRKEMMQKASISASLMEPVPRSLLLATVTNALPPTVSLLNYKLTSKDIIKAKPKRKTASRNKKSKKKKAPEQESAVKPRIWETKIEIVGLAITDLQVAQLISNLNGSHLFKQVNLIFSEEHNLNDELIRHFKLLVILDSNARASEEDVSLARQKGVRPM